MSSIEYSGYIVTQAVERVPYSCMASVELNPLARDLLYDALQEQTVSNALLSLGDDNSPAFRTSMVLGRVVFEPQKYRDWLIGQRHGNSEVQAAVDYALNMVAANGHHPAYLFRTYGVLARIDEAPGGSIIFWEEQNKAAVSGFKRAARNFLAESQVFPDKFAAYFSDPTNQAPQTLDALRSLTTNKEG